MSDLNDIQTWFSHAVIRNSDEDQTIASEFLSESSRQTAAQRLDIYTSDFWPRCLDSLSDDFPSLLNYLGKNKFDSMMKSYVLEHPSQRFTLFYLGQHVSTFISNTYKEDDKDYVQSLAALDWAMLAASIAENSPNFDPLKLTQDEQAHLPDMHLKLHPSVSLLMLEEHPTIVYRKQFKVHTQRLDRVCFDLFKQIEKGASLSTAIDAVSAYLDEKELDYLSSHIQSWFQLSVQEQWLVHPI